MQVGGEPPSTEGQASWASASFEMERRDGYEEGILAALESRLQREGFRGVKGFCR